MHHIEFFTQQNAVKHPDLINYINNISTSKSKNKYYKLKSLSPEIHCKNAFIVIKPNWDPSFSAAVLPMCFYDTIDVLEVEPILVDPKLVTEWYKVETNLALYVLDFQSNGGLKDTRYENIY